MNSTATNPATSGFSRRSTVAPIDGSLMDGQVAFDDLISPMAGLSLYGSALSRTSSAPVPVPAPAPGLAQGLAPAQDASSQSSVAARADSPVRLSAPSIEITNIPPDTSLREAYLVFSLCIDEVTYVDIVNERLSAGGQRSNDDVQRGAADTANGAPAILAYFASDKTAQQVAQLLDGRRLFGSSCAAVDVKYLQSAYPRTLQQQPQPQRTQQGQFLQGPPVAQKVALSGKSRMLFSALDSAPAASAPTSASSSSNSSSGSNSAQNLYLHQQQLAHRPETSQSFGAQSVLSSLTSPIVTSSGRNVLMLDQYDHMMHPWASSNTPVGSPVSASAAHTPLSVNTALAGANALSASSGPLSATLGAVEWDRRAHPFLAGDHRSSQTKSLSLAQGMSALGSDILSLPGGLGGMRSDGASVQPGQMRAGQQGRPAQIPQLTSPSRLDSPQRQAQEQAQQQQQAQQAQQAQQQAQQVQQAQQPGAVQDALNGSPRMSAAQKQLPPAQTSMEQQQQQQLIPELSLLSRIPRPTNPADQNPPCNTLYVGNLPPDATELELRELFQPQKGFKRLSFKNKQSNGNSHHGPMCFVEFEDVAHATRALAELYGRTLPRSGSNAKGGIRLSFSKNPLGVRGPGSGRRTSAGNNQFRSSAGASSYSSFSGGNYGQYSYPRGK